MYALTSCDMASRIDAVPFALVRLFDTGDRVPAIHLVVACASVRGRIVCTQVP